jgi:hypothetical protein
MGQRTSDGRAFPLCFTHHLDFHGACGAFRDWTKNQRRNWQDAMSDKYFALYTRKGDVF